jgi:hypothetical protein
MFNILNRETKEGKNSPMVCKFFDSLSASFRERLVLRGSPCYLLERMDLIDGRFAIFGLRIALPIWQPGLVRIRRRKD